MRSLQLAKNAGLKLEKFESIVDEKVNCTLSLQEIESTLKKYLQSPALVIVWQIQNIVWEKYENDQIKLNTEAEVNINHWLECRIFNQNEEIHLKRKGNSLRGRYIRDDELGQGTFMWIASQDFGVRRLEILMDISTCLTVNVNFIWKCPAQKLVISGTTVF